LLKTEQPDDEHLLGKIADSRCTSTRLLTYKNKYTFNRVEYAPLINKLIMCLTTINFVATTQTLHNNLQLLGVFAATVSGNIDKLDSKFDKTTHN
jgi:hypothetical protein